MADSDARNQASVLALWFAVVLLGAVVASILKVVHADTYRVGYQQEYTKGLEQRIERLEGRERHGR